MTEPIPGARLRHERGELETRIEEFHDAASFLPDGFWEPIVLGDGSDTWSDAAHDRLSSAEALAARARGLRMRQLIEVGGHVLFTDPTYACGVVTLGIPELHRFAA